jgi:hypothetical protein
MNIYGYDCSVMIAIQAKAMMVKPPFGKVPETKTVERVLCTWRSQDRGETSSSQTRHP